MWPVFYHYWTRCCCIEGRSMGNNVYRIHKYARLQTMKQPKLASILYIVIDDCTMNSPSYIGLGCCCSVTFLVCFVSWILLLLCFGKHRCALIHDFVVACYFFSVFFLFASFFVFKQKNTHNKYIKIPCNLASTFCIDFFSCS